MKYKKTVLSVITICAIFLGLYISNTRMFLCGIGLESVLNENINYSEITNASKKRVKKFSGYEIESSPIFINEDMTGVTYVFPHRSCVYIGNNGKNINVVSHEYMHKATAKKIGYFNFLFNIPAWLDEGISMQVDFREQYTTTVFQDDTASYVKELSKRKSFYSGGKEEVIKNYSAAKYVVENILKTQTFEEVLADY